MKKAKKATPRKRRKALHKTWHVRAENSYVTGIDQIRFVEGANAFRYRMLDEIELFKKTSLREYITIDEVERWIESVTALASKSR